MYNQLVQSFKIVTTTTTVILQVDAWYTCLNATMAHPSESHIQTSTQGGSLHQDSSNLHTKTWALTHTFQSAPSKPKSHKLHTQVSLKSPHPRKRDLPSSLITVIIHVWMTILDRVQLADATRTCYSPACEGWEIAKQSTQSKIRMDGGHTLTPTCWFMQCAVSI